MSPCPPNKLYLNYTLNFSIVWDHCFRKQRAIRLQYSSWRKINQDQASIRPVQKNKCVQGASPIDSLEKSLNGMFHDIAKDDGNLQNFFSTLTPLDFPLNFDEDLLFPPHSTPLTNLQACRFEDVDPNTAFPLNVISNVHQLGHQHPHSLPNNLNNRPDTSSLVTLANCATTELDCAESDYYPQQRAEYHDMDQSQNNLTFYPPQSYLPLNDLQRQEPIIDVTVLGSHGNEQQHSSKVNHYTSYNTAQAPRNEAYYPPTNLQYCYSNGDEPKTEFTNTKPIRSYTTEQSDTEVGPTAEGKKGCRNADRKRRRKMKDQLFLLRDALPENMMVKKSNALILAGAADYISLQEGKIKTLEANVARLNCSIDRINSTITDYQNDIPENGLTSACYHDPLLETQYNMFVQQQTEINPQFNIFSSLISPVFDYYNSMVNTETLEKFCQSVNVWFTQHCSLNNVRQLAVKFVTRPDLVDK